MVIGTIAAENYLPKAMHMAETTRRYHPDATIVLLLVEKTMHPAAREGGFFDHALLARDLRLPQFHHFAFRHTAIELATAVKPAFLQHLLRVFPDDDLFYYVDPDIEVHGPFVEADEALATGHILVTPHHLEDITNPQDIIDLVLPVLRCGIFNLGFLGLRRSEVTKAFLAWWAHKVSFMCYVDYGQGLFVDQKWVDLACGLFPLTILTEPGYNVARWNLVRRPIAMGDGGYRVCGRPLRSLHFSQADIGKDQLYLRRHAPQGTEPIHGLRREYLRRTREIKEQIGARDTWSYDYFDSGERISMDARVTVRHRPQLLADAVDPFASSGDAIFAARARESDRTQVATD